MKLRLVKKYLFNECYLDTLKRVKPAENGFLFLDFAEHKKYRKPFKGLKYFSKEGELIGNLLWKQEKQEWFDLMELVRFYKVPSKFNNYALAYCDWYKRSLLLNE